MTPPYDGLPANNNLQLFLCTQKIYIFVVVLKGILC